MSLIEKCGQAVFVVVICLNYRAPDFTHRERLGCMEGYFSNRFNDPIDCLQTCYELNYLYMYLQSLVHNSTFKIPDVGGLGSGSTLDPEDLHVYQQNFEDVEDDSVYAHHHGHEDDEENYELDMRRHGLAEILAKISGSTTKSDKDVVLNDSWDSDRVGSEYKIEVDPEFEVDRL